MSNLSILCVTRGEECIQPLVRKLASVSLYLSAECVIVCDGNEAELNIRRVLSTCLHDVRILNLPSQGYIESILDQSIAYTTRDYIFRIDDDESLSEPLVSWLADLEYETHPHWKFPRANLCRDSNASTYIDASTYIRNPPLYPDHQTRLSTRALSLGRTSIHCGSPHGGGELCPWPILHHKFLVKSFDQRQAIVKRYDSIYPGSGTNFLAFSLPEEYYTGRGEEMDLRPVSELLESA